MHAYINIATQAARKAGQIITRHHDHRAELQVSEKSANDFVTEVDQRCEQAIIEEIHKAYPNHAILAEESGASGSAHETQWIIDPLDGTMNFIHRFPHVAVSIAIKENNRIEHGVIYDPFRDELFTVTRGRGAQCNQQRLRIDRKAGLESAFMATGFPFRNKIRTPQFMRSLESVFSVATDIRRTGSAALDLAYVAAGRLDGYWEWDLGTWDIAAGSLMVREAGGMVCDIDGSDNYLQSGNIIAGNTKLIKELLYLFKEVTVPDTNI